MSQVGISHWVKGKRVAQVDVLGTKTLPEVDVPDCGIYTYSVPTEQCIFLCPPVLQFSLWGFAIGEADGARDRRVKPKS